MAVSRATLACAVVAVLAACGGGGEAAAPAPAGQPQDTAKARAAADSARMIGGRMPSDTVVPLEYRREVFRYGGGPRDPFESLVTSSDVRPTIADLRLVSVAYDPRYGNSVALVRETGNPIPHRLRRGMTIGRLRVIQIRQTEVVFQIEEFGFERQEVLALPRPEVVR